MKNIYLYNAATTPLSEKAFEAMKPYFTDVFGNANSQHAFGREAAKAVADARLSPSWRYRAWGILQKRR